jgi:uncharacterized protein (DUF302 family)
VTVAMEFTYRREGTKTFHETVEAVERTVRSHGFVVSRSHDLQATLASKGFEIQPLRILEIAEPQGAAALCKIHVYAEGDSVWVTAIRPSVLWQVMDRREAAGPDEAEASVVELVDASVS